MKNFRTRYLSVQVGTNDGVLLWMRGGVAMATNGITGRGLSLGRGDDQHHHEGGCAGNRIAMTGQVDRSAPSHPRIHGRCSAVPNAGRAVPVVIAPRSTHEGVIRIGSTPNLQTRH
jgi:hypothetical protein